VTTVVRREDLARSLADAVTAVPGVAALTGGPGVEVATFFSGGKVTGLHLGDDQVDVHVVIDQTPLQVVAEAAAGAALRVLSAAGDSRRVQVIVEDVALEALGRRGR
jgi:phenylpyruvate tautomerase PptA (4-oxalocrotonate tautomerase family)